METDKRTLKDLSFTGPEASATIMNMIDHTTTFAGRDVLYEQVHHSPRSFEALCDQQDVIKFWTAHHAQWPAIITNGTIVMLEKFYEAADNYAGHPGGFGFLSGKFMQKLLNRNQYFYTEFSLTHLSDFLKGCKELTALLSEETVIPRLLKEMLGDMNTDLQHRLTEDLIRVSSDTPYKDLAQLVFRARREMKGTIQRLTAAYAQLDAWHAMAVATLRHQWVFPELKPSLPVHFSAVDLYHPLLPDAIKYNVRFNEEKNFMILTGANMSGKTTFMRSLGVAALLAHMGMGVPAVTMSLSFLQGIITNMHVEDDLLKGESYFLSEVRNMKHTALSVASRHPHLVLMDELFKGTNVHDAYECTRAIVEGLLLHPHHIMVLSTHLYEVAHSFEGQKGIDFYCFTTTLGKQGNYEFSYQLKPGISDDRIGYKILVKEGIVDILKKRDQG